MRTIVKLCAGLVLFGALFFLWEAYSTWNEPSRIYVYDMYIREIHSYRYSAEFDGLVERVELVAGLTLLGLFGLLVAKLFPVSHVRR